MANPNLTKLRPALPKTLKIFHRVYGAVEVSETLAKKGGELPGMALARALADAVVAELRAELAGQVLREAAAQGHDITKTKFIWSGFDAQGAYLQVEPYDLAEQADA